MPELPEVETTLRGITPALLGHQVADIVVRNPALRLPVEIDLPATRGRRITALHRRAKYILIEIGDGQDPGGLIIHLGMSGALRICPSSQPPRAHDHVDLVLENGACLRFNDPRRFGLFTSWKPPLQQHPLFRHLGPEPLGPEFDGAYLHRRSRGLRLAVKNFIMDARVIAGMGNIYASEALHMAGIHPLRAAGRISLERYGKLVEAIKDVLERAIRQGGTTLRDFMGPDSRPGYFAQDLMVYEREGEPCFCCRGPIRRKVIGQRSSYYCPHCQH